MKLSHVSEVETLLPHVVSSEVEMSRSPILSVIIPNYNYEEFVGKAIESVIKQSNDQVELVVIDDGSTDASWSIISGYPQLRCFRIPNGGCRQACIRGLELTSAPFVLFLDADDELRPGSLARIIDEITPDVSKVQFALTRIDSDGISIGGSPDLENYRDCEKLKRLVLSKGVYRSPPTSGNVFRRDLCKHLYESDYDNYVDGILLYIAPFFGEVVSISDSLGLYRVHGRNVSSIGSRLNISHMKAELQRFHNQMEHLNRVLARIGYGKAAVDYKAQFVTRERIFQITILEGKRPSLSFVVGLLRHLSTEKIRFGQKVGIGLIGVLSLFMSNERLLTILSYRLKPGTRSASGLLRAMLSTHLATQT